MSEFSSESSRCKAIASRLGCAKLGSSRKADRKRVILPSIVPNFHFLDNLLRIAPSDFQKLLLALVAVNPDAYCI